MPVPLRAYASLQAVAAILFGDVSPSGREVTTAYPVDFISARNMTDMQACQSSPFSPHLAFLRVTSSPCVPPHLTVGASHGWNDACTWYHVPLL